MTGGFGSPSTEVSREVAEAAAYAVKTQQAKNPDSPLILVKVLDSQIQVVAGLNFRMYLKVLSNGRPTVAEALVYRDLKNKFSLTSWTWK